jgi:hypothetical protein
MNDKLNTELLLQTSSFRMNLLFMKWMERPDSGDIKWNINWNFWHYFSIHFKLLNSNFIRKRVNEINSTVAIREKTKLVSSCMRFNSDRKCSKYIREEYVWWFTFFSFFGFLHLRQFMLRCASCGEFSFLGIDLCFHWWNHHINSCLWSFVNEFQQFNVFVGIHQWFEWVCTCKNRKITF